METLRRRLVASLLAGPGQAARAAAQAGDLAAKLSPDGSWPDVDYQDQARSAWRTAAHLSRVRTMAQGWRAAGQGSPGEPELRAKLLAALDYWLRHDFQNPNWWHNVIGTPRAVGETLLLCREITRPEQIAKGVEILDRASVKPGKAGTGANLVWRANNQIMRGLLQDSPEVVDEALRALFAEIRLAPTGEEGIQTDFSFHQHGPMIYSGGYGAAFTADCARFVAFTRGTAFAPTPEQMDTLVRYVLDGQQWMIRGPVFDYGVVGRELVRQGKSARGLESAIERLAELPGPRQKELAGFAARLRGDASVPPLSGNRHYWKSDYMAHHRPAFFTSAHMHSTRIRNTDGLTNSENKQTHHIADGAALLYRTGGEYRDIFPVWNWRRVPGITCEQRPEPLVPEQVRRLGTTSFVGGASDGTYGLAAMDLERDALSAKKAWFYLDEGFACLGAGIACASENPVLTSVNQCLLAGEVMAAGEAAPLRGERVLDGVRWVWHDGVTYAFLAPAAVRLAAGPQTGRWSDIGTGPATPVTRDVFSLWVDHGRGVAGGSYAYLVLPGHPGGAPETEAEIARVEILSNTPALQAVRHRGSGVLEAAFRQPGKVDGGPGWNLSVDQPCLVICREVPGGVRITAANPENKPLALRVTLDRALAGPDAAPAGPGATSIRFALPDGEDAGRGVSKDLRT